MYEVSTKYNSFLLSAFLNVSVLSILIMNYDGLVLSILNAYNLLSVGQSCSFTHICTTVAVY